MATPEGEGMISRLYASDKNIVRYEQALQRARWAGRLIGYLHTSCSILAFWNLTGATVILLGAYVNSLHPSDFYIVFTLLLLEATRIASASFFIQLLTRAPNAGHRHQLYSSPSAPQLSGRLSFLPRLLSPVLQILLIAPSFACSADRSSRIHYPKNANRNLQFSLRFFYTVVIIHAVICFIIVILDLSAWMHFERLPDKSVLTYYDEVLHNSLMKGVLRADNFNFFHFAFGLLAREYACYKRWQTVIDEHGLLLRYLYSHKQGADYLLACLGSEDAAVQQAAANTVGAWAQEIGTEVQLPTELLVRLADMVGTGEVGWAAVNSFGSLARKNPRCVMRTRNSSMEPVLHRIVDLVDRDNGSRSLASVRTLILFYDKLQAMINSSCTNEAATALAPLGCCCSWKLPRDLEKQLEEELRYLLQQESQVQRLRVQAAYLLYIMGMAQPYDKNFKDLVATISPTKDTHWFEDEKQMLEHLLGQMQLLLPSLSDYPGAVVWASRHQLTPPNFTIHCSLQPS